MRAEDGTWTKDSLKAEVQRKKSCASAFRIGSDNFHISTFSHHPFWVHFKWSLVYGLRKKSRRACPDWSGQALRDLKGVGA
jgi:hypothetical protein